MKVSISCTCLFCGEGVIHKDNASRNHSAISIWDDECISVLISILFHSADKAAAENVLRKSSYCESCKLDLRDLSLSHKIISNTRRQMAKVLENIISNVTIHSETRIVPRKSKRASSRTPAGDDEAVSILYSELQDENWTLQPFEYIESAILKCFVEVKDFPVINPLLFDADRLRMEMEELEQNYQQPDNFIIKNEPDVDNVTRVEMEIDVDSDFNPVEDLVSPAAQEEEEAGVIEKLETSLLRNQPTKDDIETPEKKLEVNDESLEIAEQINTLDSDSDNVKGDSDGVVDSDYFDLEETEESENDHCSDDEYRPPVSKKRKIKNESRNNQSKEGHETFPTKIIRRPRQGVSDSGLPTSSSSKYKRKRKQKPRMTAEQMKKSLEEYPVKCLAHECYQRFRSEIRMEGHFNRYHKGDNQTPYRCPFCNKDKDKETETTEIIGFKIFDALQNHVRSAHNTLLPCDTLRNKEKCSHCGKYFRNTTELAVHVAAKHEKKSLEGSCNICSKCFETTEEMEAHKLKIHQGKYPFTCEDCDKIFADGVALRFHVKQLHSSKDRVTCKLCKDKSFLTEERLKFHEYSNHPELRGAKFQCKLCDLTFKNYYFYRDHRLEFHRETLKVKELKCLDCNKTFKRTQQFTSHRDRIHSSNKEKTFKCSICPKAFTSVGSLKDHERSHSGMKYPCYACGSLFSSQNHLTIHVRRVHADGRDSSYRRKPKKPRNKTHQKLDQEGHKGQDDDRKNESSNNCDLASSSAEDSDTV